MKKVLVITTINNPTKAMRAFEDILRDWLLIVVGDLKTPNNESYLSVDEQARLGYTLYDYLPHNHYSRKNLGYLHALERGAEIIYDTDDDNFPYTKWSFPSHNTQELNVQSSDSYYNAYKSYTSRDIWPRGFPLKLIKEELEVKISKKVVNIGAWQGLADLDPDVDAIYRLLNKEEVHFEPNEPIALEKYTYCPFNSQNTFWQKATMPYAYLPISVSFRFTDILRGYIAQRCFWEHDLHLGFTKATVYQERNQHDLLKDLEDEIECYLSVEKIVSSLNALELRDDCEYNLITCYSELQKLGFVKDEEIPCVKAWIRDIKRFL